MKNATITKFSQRLINCLTDGGHAGNIDSLVKEIAEEALLERLSEVKKSLMYVAPYQVNAKERLDKDGVSRFSLGISDEGACMVPDAGGYWRRAETVEMK